MSMSTGRHAGRPAAHEPDSRPSARRHGVGFWMIASAFLVSMVFGAVPTPEPAMALEAPRREPA